MKREVLAKLPPEMILGLARKKGYTGNEEVEQVVRWLLDLYVTEGSRTARDRSGALLSKARHSLDSIRTRFTSKEPPPSPKPADVTDQPGEAVPSDPAMRTMTLAHVYESQGMLDEALAIYREIAHLERGDVEANEGIERIRKLKKAGEEASPPGPPRRRPAEGVAHHPGAEEDLPSLPGKDEATLFMVTPSMLYACWEVTPESHRRALGRTEDREPLLQLRVSRIDPAEYPPRIDLCATIEIADTTGEYFLHGMMPGAIYHAEIGLSHAGDFVSMVRTSTVTTASGSPSERVDEQWMEVDQSPLDARSVTPSPPVESGPTTMNSREIAFARLHAIGPEAYSSLTGLDLDQLREVLSSTMGPVSTPTQDQPSSDCLHANGREDIG